MTERLIPDPPLGNLPRLSDGLRWRIEGPSDRDQYRARPLRTVALQKRVMLPKRFWQSEAKHKWVDVYSSVWSPADGLGDLDAVNSGNWYRQKGLAAVLGHILERTTVKHYDALVANNHIYGVSKF